MSSGRTRFVLIVSLLLSLTSEAQGDEKPHPPGADAEEDWPDSFARWAATSSRNASPRVVTLERTGVPALGGGLRKAAADLPGRRGLRPARLPIWSAPHRGTDWTESVLADYRFFGLPFLAGSSPLVRLEEQPGHTLLLVFTPDGKKGDDYIPTPLRACLPG